MDSNIFIKKMWQEEYEVPLVYFDLSDDYYKLTNAIYANDQNVHIGVDIICCSDISRGIHDLLLSYYSVIYNLVTENMTIHQIINDELLFDIFKKEIQEQSGKKIILI